VAVAAVSETIAAAAYISDLVILFKMIAIFWTLLFWYGSNYIVTFAKSIKDQNLKYKTLRRP